MLLSLGLGALVAGAGWKKGALSADGALVATLVGAATFGGGGLPAGLGLVTFFISGSALSRRKPVRGEVAAGKGHRRDAAQVLANGGLAALASALSGAGCVQARGAALGALAAAAADTWASEIGVRSPSPPRSIVSGQVVRPGTSGGTTPLGWLAAAAGALIVGAAWAAADRPGVGWRRSLATAIVSGLAGALADSLAGATVQAAYSCSSCGQPAETPSEHCGVPMPLTRGTRWVTNDLVNGIGTATGAAVGAALARGC